MNGPIPLLFLGDNPATHSGLARIGRDLATLASQLPEFKIGFLGRGGTSSSRLPFLQYTYPEFGYGTSGGQWGETYLEQVWRDFAGNQTGIIMTIWDASRLDWFALPQYLPEGRLRSFLTSGRFQRWGYFPIDGEGVGGKMSRLQIETVKGFDRVLAYGPFGARVIAKSVGVAEDAVEWMPHGFDDSVFCLGEAYTKPANAKIVGCVMTNQVRKDWGTAFETFALFKAADPAWKFWCHTDDLTRHWDFNALLADFDVATETRITMTGDYSDTQLAMMYRMCDVTILPSLGEGFGYPIVESMACGVPCIRTEYAGGLDLPLLPTDHINPNPIMRLDTRHNIYRPVLSADGWFESINETITASHEPGSVSAAVTHLAWRNLAPRWKRWFKDGL